jgi:hypothetical protein
MNINKQTAHWLFSWAHLPHDNLCYNIYFSLQQKKLKQAPERQFLLSQVIQLHEWKNRMQERGNKKLLFWMLKQKIEEKQFFHSNE